MYRDALSCSAVREALWPLDRPRPYSEEEEAAHLHLGCCGGCRDFFTKDAALARAMARHGAEARAPASLRERILDAIDREEGRERFLAPPPAGRAPRVLGVPREILRATALPARLRREGLAVAVTFALLATAALVGTGATEGPGDAYARDYLNRAVQEHAILTPDPSSVSRYFMREMGIGVRPVTLEDGELTRAMVCLLEDRRAAMVEYVVGGHIVAHYRVPKRRETSVAPSVGQPRIRTASERGVSIVSWRDASFEHALVSDLPVKRLKALAEAAFAPR